MNSNEFATIVGIVSAAASGFVTLLATKGVDAWIKLRADQRTDDALEEQRLLAEAEKEDNTLRFIIGRQDARIEQLEKELRELHVQHNDCEKKHEALRVRLELLEMDVKRRAA